MKHIPMTLLRAFGGATLLLQDETFIKWKPTVLYWLFGVVLAGAARPNSHSNTTSGAHTGISDDHCGQRQARDDGRVSELHEKYH